MCRIAPVEVLKVSKRNSQYFESYLRKTTGGDDADDLGFRASQQRSYMAPRGPSGPQSPSGRELNKTIFSGDPDLTQISNIFSHTMSPAMSEHFYQSRDAARYHLLAIVGRRSVSLT